jgi:TPR repeat protein
MVRLTNDDATDDAEGFAQLLRAAQAGLAVAQYDLAVCYERGVGTQRDEARSVVWLERAALQGYVDAEYKLGHAYRTGRGVTVDKARACGWYLKAAKHGDTQGQHNIANCYRLGDGVPKDLRQAVMWFERAAGAGDVQAMANIARLSVETSDWVTAERWLLIVGTERRFYSDNAQREMDALRVEVEAKLGTAERRRADAEAHSWLHAHPNAVILP